MGHARAYTQAATLCPVPKCVLYNRTQARSQFAKLLSQKWVASEAAPRLQAADHVYGCGSGGGKGPATSKCARSHDAWTLESGSVQATCASEADTWGKHMNRATCQPSE